MNLFSIGRYILLLLIVIHLVSVGASRHRRYRRSSSKHKEVATSGDSSTSDDSNSHVSEDKSDDKSEEDSDDKSSQKSKDDSDDKSDEDSDDTSHKKSDEDSDESSSDDSLEEHIHDHQHYNCSCQLVNDTTTTESSDDIVTTTLPSEITESTTEQHHEETTPSNHHHEPRPNQTTPLPPVTPTDGTNPTEGPATDTSENPTTPQSQETTTLGPDGCPPHSYRSNCTSSCAPKCYTIPTDNHFSFAAARQAPCDECIEDCACEDGYVIDASATTFVCVPQQNCSCTDTDGILHPANDTWLNSNCTQSYRCENGSLVIDPHQCKPNEKCTEGDDWKNHCVPTEPPSTHPPGESTPTHPPRNETERPTPTHPPGESTPTHPPRNETERPTPTYPHGETTTTPEPVCPENSYFSTCVSKCADSCESFVNAYPHINDTNNDPGAPHFCIEDEDCKLGCQCNDGYLADYVDDKLRCVKSDKCGCLDENGNYHNQGEIRYKDGCKIVYWCAPNNTDCGSEETCEQDGNGSYKCVPRPTPSLPPRNETERPTPTHPSGGSTEPFTLSTLNPGSHGSTTSEPIYECIQQCYYRFG